MTKKQKRIPNEPPEGHIEELTPSQRARILTRLHIEDADLTATAERVAITLLGEAIDGRVSTSEVALWRIIKRMKPDQAINDRDIDLPVLKRLFDDLLRAGVLIGKRTNFGSAEDTIVCSFMAWPRVITRPINAWFAVGERLPSDGLPVVAFYTYTEGEVTVEKWARSHYIHSNNTWYEAVTSDRGLRLALPIVQNVTHWAEVEMPRPEVTQ